MKNSSRLLSIIDPIIRTWGSLSIGTRGQFKMGTRGSVCSGISIIFVSCSGALLVSQTQYLVHKAGMHVILDFPILSQLRQITIVTH